MPATSSPPSPASGERSAPRRASGLGLTLIVLLIGGAMFALGVYVGRGTVPIQFDIDQLNRHLVLFREGLRQETEEATVYRQVIDDATKLDFPEVLKKTGEILEDKGFAVPAPPPVAHGDGPNGPKAAEPAKPKDPPPVAASPPPVAPVAPPVAPATGVKLVIQVASVQDSKAAEQMVAKLQAQGMQAYVVTGEVAGKGTWYRVRVGNFATRAEATEALNRMAQTNIKGMILETK